MRLFLQTLRTILLGTPVVGAFIFIPAGTLAYWQAWVLLAVAMLATNALGVYLALRDPALLERRKRVGPLAERRPAQRLFAALSILSTIALLAFCGLDYRFGWSPVPAYVALLGDALALLGLYVTFLVLRQNPYSGSTVERFEGQRVVATGLYAVIRHPMYAGNVIMMVGIPLALDSLWGLLGVPLTLALLVLRILDEERMLRNELPGYEAYTRRVRYRLVPGVW